MEGFLTGTADSLDEIWAANHGEEKRRRKERKALRRETKRQKLAEQGVPPQAKQEDAILVKDELNPISQSGEEATFVSLHHSPVLIIDHSPTPIIPQSKQSNSHTQSRSDKQPFDLKIRNSSGPSIPTPKSKKPQSARSTNSNPFKRRRSKEPQIPDEELRVKFSIPGAMEEYVASKWLNVKELKRLEDQDSTSRIERKQT